MRTAACRGRGRAAAALCAAPWLLAAVLGSGCGDRAPRSLRAALDSMLRKDAAEMPRYLPELLTHGPVAVPVLEAEQQRLQALRPEVVRLAREADAAGDPRTARLLEQRVADLDAARKVLDRALRDLRSR